MSQTILFVCATGIATSTAVTEKVMEYCKEHGLNVNYSQTNVASLPGNTDGVALVVSTTKVPYELDVPVVNGLPIITGIGEETGYSTAIFSFLNLPPIIDRCHRPF